MRFINVIADFNQSLSMTNASSSSPSFTLNDALLEAQRIAKPGTLIFLLSDFLDFDAVTEKHIQALSKHNDIAAIRNYDALEIKLPPPGAYSVSDGNSTRILDTQAHSSQAIYEKHITKFNEHLSKTMTRMGIPYIEQDTVTAPNKAMQQLMKFVL